MDGSFFPFAAVLSLFAHNTLKRHGKERKLPKQRVATNVIVLFSFLVSLHLRLQVNNPVYVLIFANEYLQIFFSCGSVF